MDTESCWTIVDIDRNLLCVKRNFDRSGRSFFAAGGGWQALLLIEENKTFSNPPALET
jgi:hypothetical protein